jgi:hypothetical protein
MESKPIKNKDLDRRVKLSDLQKEEILELRGTVTQISVAIGYGVSRRTIQFIWFPEQLIENKKRRAERGGSKQYYDKDKHNLAMKEHRAYKRDLIKKGLV